MAQLFPNWETIDRLKPPPTEGERTFLRFLVDGLDEEYEVFFQPYVNGDIPDIVVMRKGGGVLIVEVKDWNLGSYDVDSHGEWLPKSGGSVKSPVDQVLHYKRNLFDLHIEHLLEKKLRNPRYWYEVACAVYFHNADRRAAYDKLTQRVDQADRRSKYERFLNKNVLVFGRDSLPSGSALRDIRSKSVGGQSALFTDDLYLSFRRVLKPSWHSLENTRDYTFDEDQARLVVSRSGDQKVRGIAGSGKTIVLAQRAVNAHIRLGSPVLILTYNISLKNYIHDRISAVRREFNWDNFRIANYHDFVKNMMNNVGISFSLPADFDSFTSEAREHYFEDNYFSNLDLFRGKERELVRYSAVFIDEFQDYREAWARLVKKYFLADDGEFVVFADYGQDIYGRGVERMATTPVLGRWNELKRPHRFHNPSLKALNLLYKKHFFEDRYDATREDSELSLFGLDDTSESVSYYYLRTLEVESIATEIVARVKSLAIHSNDVCIVSTTVETVRELDDHFRRLTHERSTTMCETVEYYNYLLKDCRRRAAKRDGATPKQSDVQLCLDRSLEMIRKHKKLHFWMNSGKTKLSTVHTLKGWEVHTLFFVIEPGAIENVNLELLYSGFTRCTNNLIVFNVGNMRFDYFIRSVCDSVDVNHRELLAT